ncbi:MAG: hypothetical protein K9K93_06935 [Acholeplasmataceae bacterium]|nr:hypothetical protein [Acholeplasmataceae bacterium]
MKDLIRAYDQLPFIAKLILALPGIDGIAWGIYRIVKGVEHKDTVMLVAGILWIVLGATIFWIIDMITIIMYNKVVVFA